MKIKSDFVTNSSSTSYIVAISENLTFTKQEILATDAYQNYRTDEEDQSAKEYIDACQKGLRELKKGEGIYAYDFDSDIGPPQMAFYSIVELLDNKELVLLSFESGSDDGKILSLDKEKIINTCLALSDDILKDTGLKDIFKRKVKK